MDFSPLPPGRIYQDESHANDKRLFCGTTGTGKTTLALKMLLESKAHWKIVFDPEKQWARRIGGFSATRPADIARALAQSHSVCVDLTDLFRGNKAAQFDWICEFAWQFSGSYRGNKLFVFDDFKDYIPQNDQKFQAHRIAEIAGAGRRRGMDIFALSRTVTEAASSWRAAMSDVYAFQQASGRKADALEDEFGIDSESVQRLKQGEFLHLNVPTGKLLPGKVAIPKK